MCLMRLRLEKYILSHDTYRDSHSQIFYKIGALKNLPKFIEKDLRRSYFLIKLKVGNLQLYQKESLAQMFSCEFWKTYKNTFFKKHLRVTAFEHSLIQDICLWH